MRRWFPNCGGAWQGKGISLANPSGLTLPISEFLSVGYGA
jgi:hypothetical protein